MCCSSGVSELSLAQQAACFCRDCLHWRPALTVSALSLPFPTSPTGCRSHEDGDWLWACTLDRAGPESDFLDTAYWTPEVWGWRGLDLHLSLAQHPGLALGEPACLFWLAPPTFQMFQIWAVGYWDLDPHCCCCSVAQLWPTLCNPMDGSTPGFPVLYSLPAFAQTHVRWVDGAIQPSNPLFTLPLLFVYLNLVLSCLSTCPQGVSIFISEMNH